MKKILITTTILTITLSYLNADDNFLKRFSSSQKKIIEIHKEINKLKENKNNKVLQKNELANFITNETLPNVVIKKPKTYYIYVRGEKTEIGSGSKKITVISPGQYKLIVIKEKNNLKYY